MLRQSLERIRYYSKGAHLRGVVVGMGLFGSGLALLTGCPGTGPGDGGGNSGPAEMRVTRFDLAAGAVQTVSSNLKIIASEGMVIDGDLMVDASEGGDLELIAETGDIIVRGRILGMDPNEAAGRRAKSGRREQVNVQRNGASIILTALFPGAAVELGPSGALLQAVNGIDMPDESFNGPGPVHQGRHGTDGGNCELRAPQGTVRFTGGRVQPGDGGEGAHVDARDVESNESRIEIRGGNGGNSGRLIIDAMTVEGAPTLADLEGTNGEESRLFEPRQNDYPRGGAGGDVLWSNSQTTSRYPNLIAIGVLGGAGGDGSHRGGAGGFASYISGRVINDIGKPVAAVTAFGGNAGDVFGAPVPTGFAQGGDGGAFRVVGNHGWDGGLDANGTEHRDGGTGGEVTAWGGSGGDVLADVETVDATAGDGGNPHPTRGFPVFDISQVEAISGNGGRGMNGCVSEDQRGGKGGDSGHVTVTGGAGGGVLSSMVRTSFCGDGGSVGKAWRGRPGNGGDGIPRGGSGFHRDRRVTVGEATGGIGCNPGEDLGDVEALAFAVPGVQCGVGEENPCGGPEEGGFDFTATRITMQARGTITITLSQTYIGGDPPMYRLVSSVTDFTVNPERIESFTTEQSVPETLGNTAHGALLANRPHCNEFGMLVFPDDLLKTEGNVSFSFSGCTFNIYGFKCPAELTCDPDNDAGAHNPVFSGLECP